jgi:hypothetical protein
LKDIRSASLTPLPSVGQCRSDSHTVSEQRACKSIYVPVVVPKEQFLEGKLVGIKNIPLMPTTPRNARKLIKSKEATPFFKKGIFCIRLNRKPYAEEKQEIAVGIDPGSKKEGFTVKSEAHTFLNIQADAVQHVKAAVETRRVMRRSRRNRKTPCRKNRLNRAKGKLAPSTKARWQWKLRIVHQLAKIFPITDIVVEDIKAKTIKGARKWNESFSPLEVGKKWFYDKLKPYGKVHLKQGYDTKALRDNAGLSKTKSKLSEVFEAHCVDSWVLANWLVGGHIKPDNTKMLCISPIRLHRRQLHVLQFAKGSLRKAYGSTKSLNFKRGSLVKHIKLGYTYVGGTMDGKVSLHSITTGERLTKCAKTKDIKFKSHNIWRVKVL